MKHLRQRFEVSERRACQNRRSTPLQPALHLYKGWQGRGSDAQDGCPLQEEPTLRLPPGMGAAEERGLGSEQETDSQAMERGGAQGPGK